LFVNRRSTLDKRSTRGWLSYIVVKIRENPSVLKHNILFSVRSCISFICSLVFRFGVLNRQHYCFILKGLILQFLYSLLVFLLVKFFYYGRDLVSYTGFVIALAGKGPLLHTKGIYYSCLQVGEDWIW